MTTVRVDLARWSGFLGLGGMGCIALAVACGPTRGVSDEGNGNGDGASGPTSSTGGGVGGSVPGNPTDPTGPTNPTNPSDPTDPTGGAWPTDGDDASDDAVPPQLLDINPPANACASADECVLVDNCCACGAQRVDHEPPPCPADCKQPTCSALGITLAECHPGVAWGCKPANDCNPDGIECRQAPPTCDEGQLPIVIEGCWGPCIPITSCRDVDCAACGDAFACLEIEGNDICVDRGDCDAVVDCNCLGLPCPDNYECVDAEDGPRCDAQGIEE